ncbi:hypothetical protein ASD02_06690 [Ensifer sp. Root1252]|nr:hypothetical protein ASD00_23665 [Ensifer sp. Root31]KQW58664.1 hypothetical protein ASD02_06690 [Ensifer sp. Root1252]OMQ41857.1 hypothetical protein BKP54_26880 [Ensifer sp. 1H6]
MLSVMSFLISMKCQHAWSAGIDLERSCADGAVYRAARLIRRAKVAVGLGIAADTTSGMQANISVLPDKTADVSCLPSALAMDVHEGGSNA